MSNWICSHNEPNDETRITSARILPNFLLFCNVGFVAGFVCLTNVPAWWAGYAIQPCHFRLQSDNNKAAYRQKVKNSVSKKIALIQSFRLLLHTT